MNVSMIGPVFPYRGGIAHYTSALTRALEARGHRVQVISFKRQYPAFLYPGQTDKDTSATAARIDAEFLLDPFYPWTWTSAVRAIQRFQPDLALIQWWTTFWAPAYAVLARELRHGTQVAYLIHNVLPHETRPWDRALARLALSSAHRHIVQAPSEEHRLLDLIPGAQISMSNHPVYSRLGTDFISRQDARMALGLPLDRPVLLFFGIVRPYKGLRVLLDALAQSQSSVQLVVAGEFWEDVDVYRRQIQELGLTDRVTLLDRYIPNEEAHVLFSAADGLVAPYVGGTQSGTVQLARGYGLPAILTDRIAAGMPDEQAVAMQVVPAGNSAALSQALVEFVQRLPGRPAPRPATDDWGQMVGTIEHLVAQPARSA